MAKRAGIYKFCNASKTSCDDTILVSVMLANNEVGVIQPLAELGALCKRRGIWLHTDATRKAVGKIAVDVEQLQVDLLSFNAHKIFGPKGIGALYVRRREPNVRLEPLLDGGGQEGSTAAARSTSQASSDLHEP